MYDESDSCRDVVCSSVNERAMVRYFLRLWWWFYFVDIGRQPEVRLAVYRTVQYNSLRRLVTQLDTVLIVYSFYFPCLTPSTINSYLLHSYDFLLGLISVVH